MTDCNYTPVCNSALFSVLPYPGVQMFVCNKEHYGYLPVPLKPDQNLEDEVESFSYIVSEALSRFYNITLKHTEFKQRIIQYVFSKYK